VYFKCKYVRIEYKISELAEVESASFFLGPLIANPLIFPTEWNSLAECPPLHVLICTVHVLYVHMYATTTYEQGISAALLEPKTFFSNIPSWLSYDLFLAYFNLKDVKSGVISSNVR
jgi:hypothetical protein